MVERWRQNLTTTREKEMQLSQELVTVAKDSVPMAKESMKKVVEATRGCYPEPECSSPKHTTARPAGPAGP